MTIKYLILNINVNGYTLNFFLYNDDSIFQSKIKIYA